MDALISGSAEEADRALGQVLDDADQRFVPVLIELMRASQIGLINNPTYGDIINGLEKLSGQSYGQSWPDWIEWYGGTELEPPPMFKGWKGQLFGRIDPDFAEFFQGEVAADFRVEEIVWGGVAVDGIPALDNPGMVEASRANYLEPGEPVFGIELEGEARAYPLRIMDWHEMANDQIGGVPVSLAYCTLCGAGIAYDGRTDAHGTLTFGSSGLLYRSNKLMYDRQTRTLWNQLTGEPVLGELVGSGIELDLLPVVVSSWQDWLDRHPETLVLSSDTGYSRNYTPGAAYGDYFSSTETMFPVWNRDNRLADKERIFALRLEGIPKAYPLEVLNEHQVVNDQIGRTSIVLVMPQGQVTVEGGNLFNESTSYQAGGAVRAYERNDHRFQPGPAPDQLVDASGKTWQITERELVGPENEKLPRVSGHLSYWFGWYSFFPQTELYAAP